MRSVRGDHKTKKSYRLETKLNETLVKSPRFLRNIPAMIWATWAITDLTGGYQDTK
jgi:hypothetical protein